MLETVGESLNQLLGVGVEGGDIGVLHAAVRTVVVYVVSLVLVRLGNKRFMAQASAFDLIVAIMLGSVMSRAINGSAPLPPSGSCC